MYSACATLSISHVTNLGLVWERTTTILPLRYLSSESVSCLLNHCRGRWVDRDRLSWIPRYYINGTSKGDFCVFMVICVVLFTLLFPLSTFCVKEYYHVQQALIQAIKVLCYSLWVCCLWSTHSSQSYLWVVWIDWSIPNWWKLLVIMD